jgi:hypothetical protein
MPKMHLSPLGNAHRSWQMTLTPPDVTIARARGIRNLPGNGELSAPIKPQEVGHDGDRFSPFIP